MNIYKHCPNAIESHYELQFIVVGIKSNQRGSLIYWKRFIIKRLPIINVELKGVYLASPYGFTDAGRDFMKKTMIPIIQHSFKPLNPWESFDSISQRIKEIYSLTDIAEQNELLKEINKNIALSNEKLLEQAEIVVAVLDGSDIDSGVAAEIGYACAMGKKIIGYRSDFRVTGDNSVAVVNLQIEYLINKSGGKIVRTLTDLKEELEKVK